MKAYEFTLILNGADDTTAKLEDSLYEAGCDDVLINFKNGTVYLDFTRQAHSLNEAVILAIKQVESMPLDVKVISVAPENLVSESDIARRLHLKKQTISLWAKGLRRKNLCFPKPVMKLSEASPLWRWHEIVDWSLKNNVITEPEAWNEAIFIENINLVLEERSVPEKSLRDSLIASLAETR